MSSITELEFIQLLHQTRNRLQPNSGFPKQSTRDISDSDDDDQGMIMKLDSRIPAPASICTQSQAVADLALTSASLLQSIPDVLLKKLNQVTEQVQKNATRLLPFLLYASLVFLGFQAVVVIVLLSSAILSFGLVFLLTCVTGLGGLFVYTSSLGPAQQPSPPPTPSHSSTSLSTLFNYKS